MSDILQVSETPLALDLDVRDILDKTGILESSVMNTAVSDVGFPYYAAVDRGRRAVFPRNAKALRIPTPQGVIFRRSAGPAAPRNITLRSLNELSGNVAFASTFAAGNSLHEWWVSFLNSIAQLQANSLAQQTPIRTGNLAGSFEVRRAG